MGSIYTITQSRRGSILKQTIMIEILIEAVRTVLSDGPVTKQQLLKVLKEAQRIEDSQEYNGDNIEMPAGGLL